MSPTRYAGLALAVALHAAALAAWWFSTPARQVLAHTAPIIVRLIIPETPPQVPPPAPTPKSRVKRAAAPPPRMEVPTPTPIPLATPISLPETAPEMLAFDPAPIEVPASLPPAPPALLAATGAEPSYSADYLRNPPPAYPAASRRNGEQGTVLLRVLVNAAGDPARVEIRRSSGYYRLDNAARDAVRRWKFVPGKRGGEPVDAWVIIPLAFSLTS